MIRGFEYHRKNANEIADGLIHYREVVMTRDNYEALCEAEDLVERLLSNARRAQAALLDNFVR